MLENLRTTLIDWGFRLVEEDGWAGALIRFIPGENRTIAAILIDEDGAPTDDRVEEVQFGLVEGPFVGDDDPVEVVWLEIVAEGVKLLGELRQPPDLAAVGSLFVLAEELRQACAVED